MSARGYDVTGQIGELELAGCARIFSDVASSGDRTRPELDKALVAVQPGDALVVRRLDRLGRSLQHLVRTVEDLAQRGIGFLSLCESIDTTGASAREILHIFGSLVEFERELISERTQAGRSAARALGRLGGRPPALTGTKLETAKRMYESQGYTVTAIARSLKVSETTVYRTFRRASK